MIIICAGWMLKGIKGVSIKMRNPKGYFTDSGLKQFVGKVNTLSETVFYFINNSDDLELEDHEEVLVESYLAPTLP